MPTTATTTLETTCCIAGGGPAGMMLGLLLARAGVDVTVLEKHRDFLRDFRGDTVHPSTLELLYELGLDQAFLQRPHQELRAIGARINGVTVKLADFSHLPVHHPFVAFMPQWDFLNFLSDTAKQYPTFHLHMVSKVTDLLWDGDAVSGLLASTPEGELQVRAALTVGADGRHSIVRERGRLDVISDPATIDVLWMRLSRQPGDPDETLGHLRPGRFLITLNRDDYWQCALVIPKTGLDQLRAAGLPAFRERIAGAAPFLKERAEELTSWDQIKLLNVAVDHLKEWSRPGLLCIGDCAHAMSPVGGVGINFAVQDAVATANILAGRLLVNNVKPEHLRAVQKRREWPVRVTQRIQLQIHKRVILATLDRGIARSAEGHLPWLLRVTQHFPALRRIPGRIVGLGPRPEHIASPNAFG